MKPASLRLDFIKQDITAGFVVFLVALPLCLGIALASEMNPLAGIMTGIIAGIVVSLISGSELSVSGPAAGLTVTVVYGQKAIGSAEGLMVATLLSGLFQLCFSSLRAGLLATFFPTSVIKGMLAGIGIIIAFKQIPHAIGWHQEMELEESVFCLLPGSCTHSTFSSFVESLHELSLIPSLIAVSSLALLVVWERRAAAGAQLFKIVPGALAAVMLGVGINFLIGFISPEHMLHKDAGQLVDLPSFDGIGQLFSSGPTLSINWFTNPVVWSVALTIALIGSIETLLCIEATDKLDPLRRVSRPNRELTAQGIGNILAGLLGGIPMTSVIVRSSTNIYAGAKTRLSCFTHGVLLLASVVCFPSIINRIPLAALSAVLILVGYKLANVKLIKAQYRAGLDQFLPFVVTSLSVVVFDLLTGVAIGTAVGLLVVLRMNHHASYTIIHDGADYYLRFSKDVSFLQKISLKKCLARIPNGSAVFIDAGGAMFIDFDILELLEDFKRSAEDRHIQVSIRNVPSNKINLF